MKTTHSRAKSLRTGDWLVDAVEGTQASVKQIYRNFSVMAPVSKKVKRFNYHSEPHFEDSQVAQGNNLPQGHDIPRSRAMDKDSITSSPGTAEKDNASVEKERNSEISFLTHDESGRKTNTCKSRQHSMNKGSRPRSSAVLRSILENEKTMGSKFHAITYENEISIENTNKAQNSKRFSLDPKLLASHAARAEEHDRVKEMKLGRSASVVFSPPHQQRFMNLYRRSSRAAVQMLVATGFSNQTTHQDFTENKTALQSAMLALANELNLPNDPQLTPIPNCRKEPESSCIISTANTNLVESKSRNKNHESNQLIPKVDIYHSLSMRGSEKKRPSFVLDEFEGIHQAYRDSPWYFTDKSLFIFESCGPTRRFLTLVVENIWYKRFIMVCAIIAVFIVTQLNPAGFIDNSGVDKMDRFLLFVSTQSFS